MSSFVNNEWSNDEINAVKETKELLKKNKDFDMNFLSDREIFLTCINCKFRPDKACEKFIKWTNGMRDLFDIKSFEEIFEGIGFDGSGSDEEWDKLSSLFTAYAGCGKDNENRSIMWIKARKTTLEEEKKSIRVGCIYFMAIHADLISMRNGITFVIDTTNNEMTTKIGNEGKLQSVYQSIPLRPQHIFIMGAGWIKRLVINSLITFASLFTSDKVIDRVRFATFEEVCNDIPIESIPLYMAGNGGGIHDNNDLVAYVKKRLLNFPKFPSLN